VTISEIPGYFTFLAVVVSTVWLTWQLYAVVGEMAARRGLRPWFWWALSIFMSPFVVMFMLWLSFDVKDAFKSQDVNS
jgi:hypothetical protein